MGESGANERAKIRWEVISRGAGRGKKRKGRGGKSRSIVTRKIMGFDERQGDGSERSDMR